MASDSFPSRQNLPVPHTARAVLTVLAVSNLTLRRDWNGKAIKGGDVFTFRKDPRCRERGILPSVYVAEGAPWCTSYPPCGTLLGVGWTATKI